MHGVRQVDLWDPTARRHTNAELWAIVQAASDRGIDVGSRLDSGPVSMEALCCRATLISFCEQLTAQRCLGVPVDEDWAIAAASRLHATSYGLAGFGLLCNETLGSALQFCASYAPLFGLKHVWDLRVEVDVARLTLQRGYPLASLAAGEYEVHELVKAMTLLRDITAGAFSPRRVYLADAACSGTMEKLRRLLKCELITGAICSTIEFDAHAIAMALPQHELVTYNRCLEACDRQLRRVTSLDRISGRVRARLERSLRAMPSIDDVARSLCLSARSLRRRLDAEGTSFQLLAEEVRKEAAERLLATTKMSTESIADALGYGDVANFRHAFKRWKGETPRKYRDRAKPSSAAEDLDPGPVSLQAAWLRQHRAIRQPISASVAMAAS